MIIKDWLFATSSGEYVVTQKPNAPIIWAFVFWVLKHVFSEGGLLFELAAIGLFASLLYWSYLEIFKGVNNFRRFLGGTVMIINLLSFASLLFDIF